MAQAFQPNLIMIQPIMAQAFQPNLIMIQPIKCPTQLQHLLDPQLIRFVLLRCQAYAEVELDLDGVDHDEIGLELLVHDGLVELNLFSIMMGWIFVTCNP